MKPTHIIYTDENGFECRVDYTLRPDDTQEALKITRDIIRDLLSLIPPENVGMWYLNRDKANVVLARARAAITDAPK